MEDSDTIRLLPDDSHNDYGTIPEVSSHRVSDKCETERPKSRFRLPSLESACVIISTTLWTIRSATWRDVTLMLLGSLFAILSGASTPILGLFFGDMTNAFMSQSTYGLIPDEVAHARNNDSEITFERNVKMIGHVRHFVEKLSISNDTYPSLTTNGSTVIPMTASQFHSILDQYVIIYFIIGTLMLLSCFLQTICWELASEHMVFNLRKLYLSRILRQDIAWYDQNDNLNLSNKLADDAERIREGTGYKCALFIQYISTFVTGIVVGLVVNYRLTLIIMVLAPILVYLLGDIIRVSSSSMILEQEKYAAAGYVAEEALSNIRTVNAFGGQVVEVKKYNFWLEEVRKDAMKKNKKFAFLVGSMFLVMYGTYALGFAAGSYLIRIGYSSAGSVFAVFLSVISGAMIAGQCFPSLTAISSALGVLASIRNIVERNVVIDPYSEEGRKALKIIGNIEFKNTSFAYPSRPEIRVLDGFNLKIEPGKQIAIVGSSGAGKSTIISLILRYYDPTEGEVYIDDVPVRDYNVRWLRQQIGLVSQEPVLFGASIAENIKYGADDVTHSQVIEAAKKANAHDFILSLPKGYETLVGDTGSQLSGGQKQRIAIARALVRDPKILLLDEATSALDSLSEGIVQDALENVMKGRTTIIVAHRLSTIRNADMICVMQMGKFVESGTHTELMQKKSHYFDLIEAQMSREVTLPTGTENEEALDNDPKKDEVFLTPSICPLEEGNNMTIIESDVMERAMSIRELIEMQLPERRWLLMSLLGTVGCGLVVPLFAIYYGEIFEVFQLTGDALIEASKFWTYTFLVFAIYSSIVYFIQAYYTSISSDELMARARTLVFENILRQPVGWFDLDSSAPGVLVNRLAHNAPIIKAAIGVGCTQFVSCGITISASIVITLVCSWQLALVFGVVVPLAIWLLVRQQRVRNFQIKHDIQLVENAGRIASESVRNVRTVQALGRELFFTEMYARNLEVPYKNAIKRALTYSLVYGLSQGLVLYMYAIAFWFGGYLVEIGAISKENIYRVFFALSQCVTFVGTTFAYVPEFSKARQAVWLLNYLLKRESEIDSSSESGAKPDILGAVEFKDVHFAYPSRPTIEVLKGLSFSVEAGKTLALVGESGCGKSTVISLLERFYDPKSGTILVDGYNICGLNVGHLRSNIGLVSQEPILFNSSIKENIQYGAVELREIVPFEQIKNAAKLANIDDFIMSLPDRYDTLVGERGVQLSGGQKQRVAIARALIRNPKILLLDEATSALDTESEKIVQAALDEAKIGRTCIVVAHRLSTIQNADVICVLDKGKIVERGTHAELQALRGLYFQLTQRQAL